MKRIVQTFLAGSIAAFTLLAASPAHADEGRRQDERGDARQEARGDHDGYGRRDQRYRFQRVEWERRERAEEAYRRERAEEAYRRQRAEEAYRRERAEEACRREEALRRVRLEEQREAALRRERYERERYQERRERHASIDAHGGGVDVRVDVGRFLAQR